MTKSSLASFLRLIKPTDNAALAQIIRQTLMEFNAVKPGTVYYDPTTDNLFQLFSSSKSQYFVLDINDKVCGGAGIYPTEGLPKNTCELVKIYIDKSARRKGFGKELLNVCENAAKEMGYKTIYLESMPELIIALPLYEKMGYKYIPGPLGNSGHTGCTVWMTKDLF